MAKYKKRADGRYYTVVRTGKFDKDGKPIRVNLYAASSKELEQKVTETKYKLNHGVFAFSSDTTFIEYAEEWLATAKEHRGINTKNMYAGLIKNHTELLAHKKLKIITKMDIQRQINAAAEHPRTCQQMRVMFSQIFEAAIDDDILLKNPVRNIDMPRMIVKEKRAFTQAEKRAIKEADYSAQERAFIMLLYCLGLRKGEALALTWSDVNFKSNELTICKAIVYNGERPTVSAPKTNASIRVLVMHPLLREALQAYKKESKGLLLFSGEQYLTKSAGINLFRACKRRIEEALGHKTEITAHYFRHNMASELYYLVSLKEAIRILGHSDEKMIMRVYAHLDETKEKTEEKLLRMTL